MSTGASYFGAIAIPRRLSTHRDFSISWPKRSRAGSVTCLVSIGMALETPATCVLPTGHTSLDFSLPVRSGDELSLIVLVDNVGRSSLPFKVIGRLGEREAFQATWVMSILDAADDRPTSIPDDIRERVRSYQQACSNAGFSV